MNKLYRTTSQTKKANPIWDETSWLAALTALIFCYILFHFLYPLFTKGYLF